MIEKWEFLFRLLKSKNEDPEVEDKNSDREGIGLSRCISFDNLTPPVEDPQVLEGLSKCMPLPHLSLLHICWCATVEPG